MRFGGKCGRCLLFLTCCPGTILLFRRPPPEATERSGSCDWGAGRRRVGRAGVCRLFLVCPVASMLPRRLRKVGAARVVAVASPTLEPKSWVARKAPPISNPKHSSATRSFEPIPCARFLVNSSSFMCNAIVGGSLRVQALGTVYL